MIYYKVEADRCQGLRWMHAPIIVLLITGPWNDFSADGSHPPEKDNQLNCTIKGSKTLRLYAAWLHHAVSLLPINPVYYYCKFWWRPILFIGGLWTVNDVESIVCNLGQACVSGIMAEAGDIIRRLIFFGMRNYGNWLGRTWYSCPVGAISPAEPII